MESLLQDIIQLLVRLGPWIVLLVTATETAFFIGLLVPAEATVLVAAFMAQSGYFEIEHVLLATLLGGMIGDNVGYALGRFGGRRAAASHGRLGRLWRRHEPRAAILFRRRSILSVSFARFISFVRTLMPWFAGMSGMPYGRFFLYDTIGVLAWSMASVAAGYLAGQSWHMVAGMLGTASTIIVVAIIVLALVLTMRARRRMRALRRIALTGNIASGKSAVSDVWRTLGAVVIDADQLARDAVMPGSRTLADIVRRFGRSILGADGQLDRAALRQIVFSDENSRADLEKIMHPEIERLRLDAERAAAAQGAEVVIHSIPLLFETGFDGRFDTIVLVDAPVDIRRRRLIEQRGLDPAEADAMIAAQLDPALKRDRSKFVIDNAGTLEDLERQAFEVWALLEADEL